MRSTVLLLLVAASALDPSVESYGYPTSEPTSESTHGYRTISKSKKGSPTPTSKTSYGYAASEPALAPKLAYSAESYGNPTPEPAPTSSKSKKGSPTPTSKASYWYATPEPTYGYPGSKSKTSSLSPTSKSKSYPPNSKSKSKTGYLSASSLRTGWLDQADYEDV